MEYVSQAAHEGRCMVEDERFARDNKRLNELESLTRTLSDTSIKMGQILSRMDRDVSNHEARLSAVELKPAKRWDGVVCHSHYFLKNGIIQWFPKVEKIKTK